MVGFKDIEHITIKGLKMVDGKRVEDTHPLAHNEDAIDINEIWRIFRAYRLGIFTIFAAILAITIIGTLTTHPIYEATTIVMVKDSQSNPSSFMFDFSSG